MKKLTLTKLNINALKNFILTVPTPELAMSRMCVKIADDLEPQLGERLISLIAQGGKLTPEEITEANSLADEEVTFELSDEKFNFMKSQFEQQGSKFQGFGDKRAYVELADYFDAVADPKEEDKKETVVPAKKKK